MQLQLACGLSTKLRNDDRVIVCLLTTRLGTRLLTASSRDVIPSKLVDKYDTDVPDKTTDFIFLTLKMDAEFFAENFDAYIPDYTTSFIS
jgi:hypothetical protein